MDFSHAVHLIVGLILLIVTYKFIFPLVCKKHFSRVSDYVKRIIFTILLSIARGMVSIILLGLIGGAAQALGLPWNVVIVTVCLLLLDSGITAGLVLYRKKNPPVCRICAAIFENSRVE